jgi:hypothetical protein
MRLILEMLGHHMWWLWRGTRFWSWVFSNILVIIVVVGVFLAHEVFGAFVLVCAAILSSHVSIIQMGARAVPKQLRRAAMFAQRRGG